MISDSSLQFLPSEPHANHAVVLPDSQVNEPTSPEDATMKIQDSVVSPGVAGEVGHVHGNDGVAESTVRIMKVAYG
jgi:hypothetical protein